MTKKENVTYTRTRGIPPEKICEYKSVFDMFDGSKSWTISTSDITQIMRDFGYIINCKDVEEMIAKMGISGNGDGELNFEEFLTFMKKQIYVESGHN